MTLTEAIFAALLSLAPPSRAVPMPGHSPESPEAAEERYHAIAEDIAAAARTRTEAAALVGVAVHESGLAPDVDAGQCYRGPGFEARCDAGRARSLWQLQAVPFGITRRDAARTALAKILWSQRVCAGLEPGLRLAAFASGSCANGHGAARSLDASIRRALARMPAVE